MRKPFVQMLFSLSVISLFFSGLPFAQTSSPSNLAPAASPAAAATPWVTMSSEEKKTLPAQFKKMLTEEEKARDRSDRIFAKEFTVTQAQQLKDWRNQEKKAREAYFDQHLSGPDRRSYVQAYITRKKEYDERQKLDLASFRATQKQKRESFKSRQKARLAQFQEAIDHNLRPPESLWTR